MIDYTINAITNSVEFYENGELFFTQPKNPTTQLKWHNTSSMILWAEERMAGIEEKAASLKVEVEATEEARLAELEAMEAEASELLLASSRIAEEALAASE